jgi:GH18 family chitinase
MLSMGGRFDKYLSGALNEFEEKPATKNGAFKVSSYWENYRPAASPGGDDNKQPAYYMNDIKPMTHVMYAFLTLA